VASLWRLQNRVPIKIIVSQPSAVVTLETTSTTAVDPDVGHGSLSPSAFGACLQAHLDGICLRLKRES
jgi:hypothetical protein